MGKSIEVEKDVDGIFSSIHAEGCDVSFGRIRQNNYSLSIKVSAGVTHEFWIGTKHQRVKVLALRHAFNKNQY